MHGLGMAAKTEFVKAFNQGAGGSQFARQFGQQVGSALGDAMRDAMTAVTAGQVASSAGRRHGEAFGDAFSRQAQGVITAQIGPRFDQIAPSLKAKFSEVGRQSGESMGSGMTRGLSPALSKIASTFVPGFEKIAPLLENVGALHGSRYAKAVADHTRITEEMGGKVLSGLKALAPEAEAGGAAMGLAAKAGIVGAVIAGVEVIKDETKQVLNLANTELAAFGKVGKDTADTLMSGFSDVLAGKMPDVMGAFNVLEEGWQTAIQAPLTAINTGIDMTVGHIPIIGDMFKTALGEAEQAFGAFFGVFDEFKGLAGDFVEDMIEVGDSWQEAARKIAGQTLDTGQMREALGVLRDLAASGTLANFDQAAGAVGLLDQRLKGLGEGAGLTQHQLAELTKTLALGDELLGLQINVEDLTAAFNDFNIAPEQTAQELTFLVNVARATGDNLNNLLTNVDQLGPAMSELGYSLDQTAFFVGKMNEMLGPTQAGRMSSAFIQLEEHARKEGETLGDVIEVVREYHKAGDDVAAMAYLKDQGVQARQAAQFIKLMNAGLLDQNEIQAQINAQAQQLHQPFDQAVEASRTLGDTLNQVMNQLKSAFGSIGVPLIEGLNRAGDHLKNWLATHQAELIGWGAQIMEAILKYTSMFLTETGRAVVAVAPMIQAFKTFVVTTLKDIDVAMQGFIAPFTHLPDWLGGKAFREMQHDLIQATIPLNDLAKTDLKGPLEAAGRGMMGLGDAARNAMGPLGQLMSQQQDAAKIGEAFTKSFATEPGGKPELQDAFEASKEGIKLLGDPSTWAQVAAELAKLGIHIDYDKATGEVHKFTTNTMGEADALRRYLTEKLGPDAAKDLIGNWWSKNPPKLPIQVEQQPPLSNDQARDKLGLPSEVHVPVVPAVPGAPGGPPPPTAPGGPAPAQPPGYGQMPGNLGPGGILSPHPSGWQIPAQVALQPAGVVRTVSEVLDSAGIPLGYQDADGGTVSGGGAVIPTGLPIIGADKLDTSDLMTRAGIPSKNQGDVENASPGVVLPTGLEVKTPEHKTVAEVMDAVGIPSKNQGDEGVVLDVSFNMAPGQQLAGFPDATGGGTGGGAGGGMRTHFAGFGSAAGWRPKVAAVVAQYGGMLGIPEEAYGAWTDAIVAQINTESGGNPNAKASNPNDPNVQKGIPSLGLLQYTPGTYAAHNISGLPYPDPIGEIAATLDYAPRTKDGWPAGGQARSIGEGHGFAAGGSAWFGSTTHEPKGPTSTNIAEHFAHFDTGGHVKGALWAARDSVPMNLPSGTFVVRRDQALRHRGLLDKILSGGGGHAAGSHRMVRALLQPDERLVPPKIAARNQALLHAMNAGRLHAQGGGILQVIWDNSQTGDQVGEADSQLVGPGTSQPGYYRSDWSGHTGHVHTSFGSGPNGEFYGLPVGTDIRQGAPGFPSWVYELGDQFGLEASTYAGHQEKSGYNRGIDWWPKGHSDMSGASYSQDERARLQSFAETLAVFGSGGQGMTGAGAPWMQQAAAGQADWHTGEDYPDPSTAAPGGGGGGGVDAVDFTAPASGRVQLADYHQGGGHPPGPGGGHPGLPTTPAPTAPGSSYQSVPPPPGMAPAAPGTPGAIHTPYGDFQYSWDMPPEQQKLLTPEQRQKFDQWLQKQERDQEQAGSTQADIDKAQQHLDELRAKKDEADADLARRDADIAKLQSDQAKENARNTDAYRQAHEKATSADQAYADAQQNLTNAKRRQHDQQTSTRISGEEPPPWVSGRGSGQRDNQDAETLGKGLIKGAAQELGFPEVFGKPFYEWGIWKTAMAGLGFGASLLEGGGQGGGGAQPSGGGGLLGGLLKGVPGLGDLLAPKTASSGAPGGAPAPPSATPAIAASQSPTAPQPAGAQVSGGGGPGLTVNVDNKGIMGPDHAAAFVNSVISGSGTGSSQTATRGGQIGTVMA